MLGKDGISCLTPILGKLSYGWPAWRQLWLDLFIAGTHLLKDLATLVSELDIFLPS